MRSHRPTTNHTGPHTRAGAYQRGANRIAGPDMDNGQPNAEALTNERFIEHRGRGEPY